MGQGTACPNSLPQAATDLSLLVTHTTKTAQTKVCAVFVARPKELESLTFGSVAMLFECFLPLFDSSLLIHKTHKKQAKKHG